MKKKGMIILFFVLMFTFLVNLDSVLAVEGCCVSPNGCQFTLGEECTDIGNFFFYPNQACSAVETDLCDTGCCCDPGQSILSVVRNQCSQVNFYPGETECDEICGIIEQEPNLTVDTGATTPTNLTILNQTLNNLTILLPPQPTPLFYQTLCGNNQIDFYEICDGTLDTKAEGALSDCAGNCGASGTVNACRCPISCSQNPVSANLQVAQAISGQKAIRLIWSFPVTNCQPTNVILERCNSEDPLLCDWYPIKSGITNGSHIDSAIAYNNAYSYRVRAFYYDSTNNAVNKYSNVLTVGAMDKLCVRLNSASITNQFCDENYEARCNLQNQIVRVFNCDLQTNAVCISGSCNPRGNCGECATPFGLFFLPQCSYASCYLDYSRFSVDTYNECMQITSCYDYKSQSSCGQNTCGVSDCEWQTSEQDELGIGVCRPSQAEYQDCSKCISPSNALLGGCSVNICDLVGEECRYTNRIDSPNACIDSTQIGCADYKTQEDCTGSKFVGIQLDSATNRILNRSEDIFGIGTCKWIGRCIKDADGNLLRDCAETDYDCQSDNVAPITIVANTPVTPQNIEIGFSVFDNLYSGTDTITYYAIEKNWTYPTIPASGSKFSKVIGDSDFYTLTYYSVDKSKNLEEVKSFKFYVDGEQPSVNVSYVSTPQENDEDNWTSKVDITISARDNADTLVSCKGSLLQGNTKFNAVDEIIDELISDKTIHYTGIPDGYHVFNYECSDRSGNIKTDNVLINVHGDMSLINPSPTGTLNYYENIQLSITSVRAATCKYSDSINSYAHMTNLFETTNNLLHTATVDVSPLKSHHKFYVKCELLETGAIIGSENDEIRFTIDQKSPITNIRGASQTCTADWLHNDFELMFDCQDPAQRKQGHSSEFGCAQTFYCTGTGCNPITSFLNSISLGQTTPVSYYSVDSGGNSETIKTNTIQIDKVLPQVAIAIIDTGSGLPAPDRTILRSSQEPYIIQIISSKPIEKFNQFGFILANGGTHVLPTPYPNSADKTVWQTYLNPSSFTNLVTRGIFQMDAMAEHGWRINENLDEQSLFYINTQVSGQQPVGTAPASIVLTEVKNRDAIISSSILNGKSVYQLKNPDIYINGTVSGLERLWYFIGSQKIEVPIINQKFEISPSLLMLDGAELETTLYFIGTNVEGKQYTKTFSFLIDKQGPVPSSYELENSDGAIIKTPLPVIVVIYDEPTELIRYGLRNFDIQMNVTRLNDRTFRFTVSEPLSNGCYRLYVNANDTLNNIPLFDYEIGFGIDVLETQIILESPHHGVAGQANIELRARTTWPASCKYSFIEPTNFEFPLLLNFDITGVLQHKKSSFTVVNEQPFYIICDDGRSVVKQAFILKVDTTFPEIIKAVADPPIVSQQGINSKLQVETDEQSTICKFSTTSASYDQMRYFPGESKDVSDSYKKNHYKPLPFNARPRTETYYVQCEDLSGKLTSKKNIDFKVEEQVLNIEVQSPPVYTSERFFDLNFTTNEVADCKYKNVSGRWQVISSNSLSHGYKLGRLEPVTHTIDLECSTITSLTGALSNPEIAELTYTFTIDVSKPNLLSVSGGNYSCSAGNKSKLGISFNANDNESKIASYNFDVIDDKGTTILANQTSNDPQFNIDLSSTNSKNGSKKYEIIAVAVNGAGLKSLSKKSSPIFIKTSLDPECKERKVPNLVFRVLPSSAGVNVLLVCNDESGCDAASLKYGTSSELGCAPVNQYSGQIELSESIFFCGKACDSVGNCATKQEKIDVQAGDSDNDGIFDRADQCKDTLEGAVVDKEGCSEIQRYLDEDGDKVRDQLDLCPNTPLGEPVDNNGCILISRFVNNTSVIPLIIEEESNIFNTILFLFLVIALLGGLSYFVYLKYLVPSQGSYTFMPKQRIQPIKRIIIPKKPIEYSKKTGSELFKSLEETTKGKIFDKLSRFIKKEEHDLFHLLEKATNLRKTKSSKSEEVFEQLSKITSFRRDSKSSIDELGKFVNASTIKKKKRK